MNNFPKKLTIRTRRQGHFKPSVINGIECLGQSKNSEDNCPAKIEVTNERRRYFN